MNKDSNGWYLAEDGVWTAEKRDLEFMAEVCDRAPVDPWGNTIRWSKGTNNGNGWETLLHNEDDPSEPIRLRVI